MDPNEVLVGYRILPYRRTVERIIDEDGTYFVCRYPELPGLSADGTTPAEARRNAASAFDDYILAQLEWGLDIPMPSGSDRILNALRQLEDARGRSALEREEPAEVETASAGVETAPTARTQPPSNDAIREALSRADWNSENTKWFDTSTQPSDAGKAEGKSGSTVQPEWLRAGPTIVERPKLQPA